MKHQLKMLLTLYYIYITAFKSTPGKYFMKPWLWEIDTGGAIDELRCRWNNYKDNNRKSLREDELKQASFFAHFQSLDHNGFLEDNKMTFIDKTDPSDPNRSKEFWIDTLIPSDQCIYRKCDFLCWIIFWFVKNNVGIGTFIHLFICFCIYLITYLFYYYTGGPYPVILYVLFVTFIIYIITIIIIFIIIIIGVIVIAIITVITIIIYYRYYYHYYVILIYSSMELFQVFVHLLWIILLSLGFSSLNWFINIWKYSFLTGILFPIYLLNRINCILWKTN